MKKTVGTMKESLEEEMNVSEIKQEALAYKKQLLEAQDELEKVTNTSSVTDKISEFGEDFINDIEKQEPPKNAAPKEEEVTFKKKKKKKNDEEGKVENV